MARGAESGKYNNLPGDRVKIAGIMPNEPDPLPIGTMGTVVRVLESTGQIDVDWDNGRSLFLLADVDPFWVELCTGYGPAPEEDTRSQTDWSS